MKRGVLALVAVVWVGFGAWPAAAQAPGEEAGGSTRELTDLVNALLGTLMGGEDVSGTRLQEEVARVGGIPFRWDVPIAYMGHDELVRYLDDLLEEEYPPAVAEADQRMLVAFDLLEPGTDLRALRARMLEDNVAGFYDERPGRRRLYSVSDDRSLTPMNQIVLAHELRHALQDQYGDLYSGVSEDVSDFDDRRLAFVSLLEGDATLVMERFVQGRLGLLGSPIGADVGGFDSGAFDSGLAVPGLFDLPGAPRVVRDHLLMPYLVGRDLARAIDADGGAEGMIEAWRRPPDSTEQVLHPDKYLSREAPRPVVPRPDPPAGRLLGQGVLGELLLRTLLEQDADAPATAGWGGDAWRLWDTGGRTVLVWKSVWDTAADASEFDAALRARLAHRLGRGERRGDWSVFARGDGWRFAVRHEGDTVDLRSAEVERDLGALLD